MEPQFNHLENQNMPHFIIKDKLPSLNEYLSACGRHPQIGGSMKRDYLLVCCNAVRTGLKRWKPTNPVIVHFVYFEPDKCRDKDNIQAFCGKCVFDSLQKCDVLKNDGWADVVNFTHDFYVDKNNPRIEVYIEEITDETKIGGVCCNRRKQAEDEKN